MYKPHPHIKTPDESEVIWRYVDFAGFLSLIANGTLFFRRCDKFEDNWDAHYSTFSLLQKATFSDDRERTRALRLFLLNQELLRSMMFANCWHRSEHEDAAMWEVYTARRSGIAIQSTVGRLKEAFRNCGRKMFIGEVAYGDFEESDLLTSPNELVRCFIKREEYKFEKEVRVLVWSVMPGQLSADEPIIGKDDVGFSCPVDIERLIESIVIAPSLTPQMVTTVQHVMEKCGLAQIPVRHSKLAEVPPALADLDSDDPRMFTLSLRMEEPMLKLLLRVCEDFHKANYTNMTVPVHSIELLNAVNRAARNAGFLLPQYVSGADDAV